MGKSDMLHRNCHLQSRAVLEQRLGSIRLHNQRGEEMGVEKWVDLGLQSHCGVAM